MRFLTPVLNLFLIPFLVSKELLHLLLLQVCSEVIQHPVWGHAHRTNSRIYLNITHPTGLQSKGMMQPLAGLQQPLTE